MSRDQPDLGLGVIASDVTPDQIGSMFLPSVRKE